MNKIIIFIIIVSIFSTSGIDIFKVKWLTNRYYDTNKSFYDSNIKNIHGYIFCCSAYIIDRDGYLMQYESDLRLQSYINLYPDIKSEIVITCPHGKNSLLFAINNPNFGDQISSNLMRYNFSGFVFDCEIDSSFIDMQQYVKFVNNLSNIAISLNKTISLMTKNYQQYNDTVISIDKVINTATYCFSSKIYDSVNWLLNNLTSDEQISIGIQPDCNWSYQSLRSFLYYLIQKNIKHLTLWYNPVNFKYVIDVLNELSIIDEFQTQNAAYLPYGWSVHNQNQLSLMQNIEQMKKLNIIYAFCNVGTLNIYNYLDIQPIFLTQYINLARQVYPQQIIFAWINGNSATFNNIDNVNNVIYKLITNYDIDGIHFDVEPLTENDQNFINMLSMIKTALPNKYLLSIAAPYDTWTQHYIQQLNSLIDIFSPMVYDTLSKNVKNYIDIVSYGAQIWFKYCNPKTKIIPALPFYEKNEYHDPSIENLSTVMDGLFNAMNITNRNLTGYAIWNWYEMNSIDKQMWIEKNMYVDKTLLRPLYNKTLTINYSITPINNNDNNNVTWISMYLRNITNIGINMINAKFRIYPKNREIVISYPLDKTYTMLNNNGEFNTDYFSFKLLKNENININTIITVEIITDHYKYYIENITLDVN